METFKLDEQTIIERVVLKVKDLTRQIAFYERVVGLKCIKRTQEEAFLGIDNHILIEMRKVAEKEQPSKGTGLFHFALLLPSREAFATKFFHILQNKEPIDSPEEQVKVLPHFDKIIPISRLDSASDHGYNESFYIHDLEGNGIEIYADRPQIQWGNHERGVNHPLNFKELAPLADFTTDGGLPLGTVIGHVHLRLDRMEECVDFYTDILGFELKELEEHVFFVSSSDYHHQLAGNIWSGSDITHPVAMHTGLHHIVLALPTENALQKAKDHIKQFILMQEATNGFFVKDPSGNVILLKVKEIM